MRCDASIKPPAAQVRAAGWYADSQARLHGKTGQSQAGKRASIEPRTPVSRGRCPLKQRQDAVSLCCAVLCPGTTATILAIVIEVVNDMRPL